MAIKRNSVLFEFVDYGYASQNRDRHGRRQNPLVTCSMDEVHVMLNQSDFDNERIIDMGSFCRQALSPKRSKRSVGYGKTHMSGDIDTCHVATIRHINGAWGVITHPHGKSSGSVRYPYLGNATREDCEQYIIGYVNRRFKRLLRS